MTDDLVKRLRADLKQASPSDRMYERPMGWEDAERLLDRIDMLERALLEIFDYECRVNSKSLIACTARDSLWQNKKGKTDD